MYALLDENDALVNGAPIAVYRSDGAITLPDGTQFPANWMRLLTPAEKQAYHIWEMQTTSYDPNTDQITGDPTYSFDGSIVTETYATEQVPLNAYKNSKIRSLRNSRNIDLSEPVFLTFGQTEYAFSTDLEVRVLLLHVITAVNAGMTFPANFTWASIDYPAGGDTPTHESKVVSGVTEAQAKELAQAMVTHEYVINKKYVTLLEDVDNATTHAEVDAVVWS